MSNKTELSQAIEARRRELYLELGLLGLYVGAHFHEDDVPGILEEVLEDFRTRHRILDRMEEFLEMT